MTHEEPAEDAKCMAIESGDSNPNKSNGRLRAGFQDKLRAASPEQRRTLLTALLVLLALAFFVIIIILAVKVNSASSDLYDRCYTTECLESAAYIIDNIDRSVDPCEDFQKFACGGYLSRHPLSDAVTRVDLLDEVRAKLRSRTRQIIDEISADEESSAQTVRSYIAKFFQSCVDTRTLTDRADKVMEKNIRDIGGWEPLGPASYDSSRWNFDETLTRLMTDFSVFPFFKFQAKVHGRGGRNPMIMISPSGFGLGRNRDNYDSLRKPFLYRAYVNFINNAAGVLGGNTLNGFAQSSPGDKVFYFENRLLQNSNPHPRNLSVDRVVQTLAELRVLVPVVRWDHLLQHIFPDSRIDSQFRMIVEDIDYFKHLANIRATSTNDVLNTYMVWHLVKKFAPFLGKNMRLLEARFRAELVGGQVQNIDHKAHFSRCLELTNEFFGFGLAHLHRDRFNLGKNIEDAERLFSLIPRIARKHVRNVPWLKDATYKVNDRLESLRVRVAYPGLAATDNTSLIYFKEANTNRDFFDNIIDQMKLKHDWLKMAVSNKHPAKKDHAVELLPWPESLLSLEPHYSYSFNEVTVPLGMLSQPIFSATQNAGLKAATIVVVAQEMLKVIDRFGLQFSENGIVPNSTFDALAERLQCLERQTENELHAYGPMNKFLEEAVPDIAGLRVALQMLDQSASPSKLPGLDYNVRQLFYIGYGQLMCENMTETRASRTNGTLTSAPKRLRLHRTLQQTPDFADAFGCSASSRMVPLEVCDVW